MTFIPTASATDAVGLPQSQGHLEDLADQASIVYPAPAVRWYPNVEDHPSLFLNPEKGFQKPDSMERLGPVQKESTTGSVDNGSSNLASSGNLLVALVRVLVPLSPKGPAPGGRGRCYRATAHYQSEPQEVVASRMTRPDRASPSSSPGQEECVMYKQIRLPYNSREQLIKVAVYMSEPQGDTFVGEATVPICDPSISSTSPWILVRDFVEQGVVVLYVQTPNPDSSQASVKSTMQAPLTTTAMDTEASGRESTGLSASSAAGDLACPAVHCRVGDIVEVFSKAAGQWLRCTVAEVQGSRATAVHGDRQRRVNLRDEHLQDYFRIVEARGD